MRLIAVADHHLLCSQQFGASQSVRTVMLRNLYQSLVCRGNQLACFTKLEQVIKGHRRQLQADSSGTLSV